MEHFNKIKLALEYIDLHLEEPVNYEVLAQLFHFSAYYFHRMFTIIVGKPIAVYIRERRLVSACRQLAESQKSILSICLDCGFSSSAAFSRTFRKVCGMTPGEYRRQGYYPSFLTAQEMIVKFTNRLKGGILVNPNIIKRDKIIIAGVTGDGQKTAEIWQEFIKQSNATDLISKTNDHGYEIRLFDNNVSTVHVGSAVKDASVNPAFTTFILPASQYASFDVYVARGYDSENNAMQEWLNSNSEGFSQRLLNGKPYIVEFYDERFHGDDEGSIVEIWLPVEKK